MKKRTSKASLPETAVERYDWSKAARGRWAGRLRTPKIAFIRPELWERFGSNDAINEALAKAIELGDVVSPRKRRTA